MRSSDPDIRPSVEEALQSVLITYRSFSRAQLDTPIPEPEFELVPEDVQLAAFHARDARAEARKAVARVAEAEEYRQSWPLQESLPFFCIIPYALLGFALALL